jgi:hypothetical protein
MKELKKEYGRTPATNFDKALKDINKLKKIKKILLLKAYIL